LRKEGLVPAVLYGHREPNVLLSLHRSELERLLGMHAFILQVNWDGRSESVQVRELQYDPLGDHVIHVDLARISLSETVTVSVPIETHGEAAGVAEGGVLDLQLHELEVECLPTAIPEKLRVEVAQLGIGDHVRVGDIQLPEGVTATADAEVVVVAVTPPVEIEEEEAEELAEEAIAEPEVIGREAAGEEPEAEGR
jgi:large subunit ribosomal protein L25